MITAGRFSCPRDAKREMAAVADSNANNTSSDNKIGFAECVTAVFIFMCFRFVSVYIFLSVLLFVWRLGTNPQQGPGAETARCRGSIPHEATSFLALRYPKEQWRRQNFASGGALGLAS